MNIYSFVDYPENDAGARYFGTMGEAHAEGKKLEPVFRSNVRIRLLDIAVDKAGVLEILNHGGPHRLLVDHQTEIKVLRTWSLTARGGLTEITTSAV
jgi:hypothetical protein